MTAPEHTDSSRLRLTVILVVVGCLFASLLVRLWFLQVVQAPAADKQVAAASYEAVYVPAPRGEILDRNGRVLVANRQVPVIEVQQSAASDATLVSRLAALLGMTIKATKAAILNNQYSPLAPVPVYTDASASQILYIQEHRSVFPPGEVTATTENIPYVTPLGQSAAAILGYVGLPDAAELASLQKAYPSKHYQANQLIGLAGLEAQYEPYLAGVPGQIQYEVNAQGQVLGVARDIPPVPGDNLRLTIDARIQEVADKAIAQGQTAARATSAGPGAGNFKAPSGAVVAEDPRNGQVLALASEPTYNPNWFNNGITTKEYKQLEKEPGVFTNLATTGAIAPGSTFKLITATAGLRAGLVTPYSIYNDIGHITVGGRSFSDDNGIGAGPVDLRQAITVSSDNYFNVIGMDLWNGRGRYGDYYLQKVAASYGLGQPTGIDLPGESAGLIPGPSVIKREGQQQNHCRNGTCEWYTGYSIEMAIGQFQDEVTPLQLANAYSTFANGGTRYQPRVALDVETPKGKLIRAFRPVVKGHSDQLSAAERQSMIQGFRGVVNDPTGTAYGVFSGTSLASSDIAGKTGTAQTQCRGCQPTSVFTSFGPASNPKYVVDCYVLDAGYGASVAAPVVREVWDGILHKKLQPVAYAAATGLAN